MNQEAVFASKKRSFLQPIVGVTSFMFMSMNAFFWTLLVHLVSPLLLLKQSKYEVFAEQSFDWLYNGWVASNEWWFHHVLGVEWELDDNMQTDFQHWNLIIANHRSWVDVFAIFAQLRGRRPLPRVFMKQALIWLPLVGTATYIMGFPFMKRYTKAQIEKNPSLAGKDLATTKRSCRRLLKRPNSIMSFVEGTRFSDIKHQQQESPYTCLLKPKAGGVGFILQTMPQTIKQITDITVLYEQPNITGWDLLCGRIGRVKMMVREVAFQTRFWRQTIERLIRIENTFLLGLIYTGKIKICG
ncbi:acetyltransferase [Marinomonas sp. GJ51-6]|uniref:acetyltransferase n=1 Tax=Marinomonas sp. GJ51-6 TaxID=2992802 RepID=UPI002934A0BA|nr:acetyltransferase [Marinomonas sp. GJ51-6]WOD08188.1 acetyltransferase [Marinomonas sp. GJ51-6]